MFYCRFVQMISKTGLQKYSAADDISRISFISQLGLKGLQSLVFIPKTYNSF